MKELIARTCRLSTENEELRRKSQEEALEILFHNFKPSSVPANISTIFHKKISVITGNSDPYKNQKKTEVSKSAALIKIAEKKFGEDLYSSICVSALGNSIDYFRNYEDVKKDISEDFSFAIDNILETMSIIEGLKIKSSSLLFLSDNAGEFFFDMPLIKILGKMNLKVFFCIKDKPVQNDLCLSDFSSFINAEKPLKILLSGNSAVGVSLRSSSDEFKQVFKDAELIIAKGMGNYETLTEIKCEKPVLYLLKAKCEPVADSLGVKEGSFIAKLHLQN